MSMESVKSEMGRREEVVEDDEMRSNIFILNSSNFPQAPRLIIGAVYRHLKEEMSLLWTKDLKLNTVHVKDVVKKIQ